MAKVASIKGWLKVLAPVASSIGGLALLRLLGPDFVDQQTLHGWLAPMGEAAPLVYIFALTIRPLTLLPGHLFAAVGGMAFGTLAGTLYALAGSFLAAALIFGLARKLGARPLKRFAGQHYDKLTQVASKHDFQFAFLTCINPLLPTDVMLATAAASGARFWPSVAGMMLGTLPGTFLMVQFGSGLAQGRTVMTIVSGVGLLLSLVLGGLLGRRVYRELHPVTPAEPRPAEQAPAPPRGLPVARKQGLPSPS